MSKNTPKNISFENKLQDLQTLVKNLETNDTPLEESQKAYEKGQKLLQECRTYLEDAELKVQKIITENNTDTGKRESFTP